MFCSFSTSLNSFRRETSRLSFWPRSLARRRQWRRMASFCHIFVSKFPRPPVGLSLSLLAGRLAGGLTIINQQPSDRSSQHGKYLPEVNFLCQFGKFFNKRKISFQSANFLILCPFLTTVCLGQPIGQSIKSAVFVQIFPNPKTCGTKKLTSACLSA